MKLIRTILIWVTGTYVSLWKKLASKPLSVAITIVVPLLIFGWHGLVNRRFAQLHKVADELGAVRKYFGIPLPNHKGTQVLAVQTMETGMGVYLCEVSSGKRKLLYAQDEADYEEFKLLGWSPDDQLFAYYTRNPKSLRICDATGRQLARIKPKAANGFSGFTWLSSQKYVYADNIHTIYKVQRYSGYWGKPEVLVASAHEQKPDKEEAQELKRSVLEPVPYGDNAVLWQEGNIIWSCKLASKAREKIWESTTNELLGFSYSRDRNKLLLHCKDTSGEFLAAYSTYEAQMSNRVKVGPRGDPSLYAKDNSLLKIGWIAEGDGYAYLTRDGFGEDTLVIKTNASSEPIPLLWQGGVKSFSVSGERIFVIGSLTNEPLGVWEYNLKDREIRCLVSDLDRPFKHAINVAPSHFAITNAGGQRLVYHVWPPARFSPAKKYPLVIGMLFIGEQGNNQYGWQGFQEAIANGGGYFVTVPRSGSAQDMLAVYEALAKNPNIDTGKVYLLGISGGNVALMDLLETKPEPWRGVILLSPMALPGTANLKVSKILVDCGAQDLMRAVRGPDAYNTFRQFQDSALCAGIPVTLDIHEGVGHIYRSLNVEKARLHNLVSFLFEE